MGEPAPLYTALARATRSLCDVLDRRTETSRVRYLVLAAATSLTLSGVAVGLYWLVFTGALALGAPPAPLEGVPPFLEMLVGWVVFAPLGETLILAILIGVARRFGAREGVQILAGALPLGALHAAEGMTLYDAGGHALVSVVGFLVFSLVYVVWRRTSFRDAFWMSAGVHMIHNLGVVLLALVDGVLVGGG